MKYVSKMSIAINSTLFLSFLKDPLIKEVGILIGMDRGGKVVVDRVSQLSGARVFLPRYDGGAVAGVTARLAPFRLQEIRGGDRPHL